jgi:hypothetical protein
MNTAWNKQVETCMTWTGIMMAGPVNRCLSGRLYLLFIADASGEYVVKIGLSFYIPWWEGKDACTVGTLGEVL